MHTSCTIAWTKRETFSDRTVAFTMHTLCIITWTKRETNNLRSNLTIIQLNQWTIINILNIIPIKLNFLLSHCCYYFYYAYIVYNNVDEAGNQKRTVKPNNSIFNTFLFSLNDGQRLIY